MLLIVYLLLDIFVEHHVQEGAVQLKINEHLRVRVIPQLSVVTGESWRHLDRDACTQDEVNGLGEGYLEEKREKS